MNIKVVRVVFVGVIIGSVVRPAFVYTLFPVTRPHHIYSTTLVIIIVIDNLKQVIIFIYIGFLSQKIPEVSENVSWCPSNRKLRQTYCSDVYYR